MENIYSIFAMHLRKHKINKDKMIKSPEFDGICPFCGSTMYEIFDNEKTLES